jgi:predicted Fe-Mo cluster-binding NifX family protein
MVAQRGHRFRQASIKTRELASANPEVRTMKVAFPVAEDSGVESVVYNHFGSAPVFVIVDRTTPVVVSVKNRDQHHEHGACNPMQALAGQQVDAVVVGGIGNGALARLNEMGISVHRSGAVTIRENLVLLDAGSLPLIGRQGCCGGHGADGGCAHS